MPSSTTAVEVVVEPPLAVLTTLVEIPIALVMPYLSWQVMALGAGALIANRYEVVRPLGAGTFGEVYEAMDHHQGFIIALKLMDPSMLSGGWPWTEPTLLTHLRSQFILRVWNAGMHAGIPFMATALATGGTLEDSCGTLGITPRLAVAYTRDAARGVQRAHDSGVLHRDVKLENIFRADEGHGVVGDFGLAAPLGPTGKVPGKTGTILTMAPEVLHPPNEASVQSDVYSLGACLYRLLTGRYPYVDRAANLTEFEALVATEAPTPVRDLAPHVGAALAKRVHAALARNPAERYATAGDFDAALGIVPPPRRAWRAVLPTAPATHEWTGVRAGRQDARISVRPNGRQFDVVARNEPSGRRSHKYSKTVRASEIARAVRVAMAGLE